MDLSQRSSQAADSCMHRKMVNMVSAIQRAQEYVARAWRKADRTHMDQGLKGHGVGHGVFLETDI